MSERQFEAKHVPNRTLSPQELHNYLQNLNAYLSQAEPSNSRLIRSQKIFRELGLSFNTIGVFSRAIISEPQTRADKAITSSPFICLPDPQGKGGLFVLQADSWGDRVVNFQIYNSFTRDSVADLYQLGPNGLAGVLTSDVIIAVYLNRLLTRIGLPRIVTSNVAAADNRGWFIMTEPKKDGLSYWFKFHKIYWAARYDLSLDQIKQRHAKYLES